MGTNVGPIWAAHMYPMRDFATGYHKGPIWATHMGSIWDQFILRPHRRPHLAAQDGRPQPRPQGKLD